MRYSGAIRIHLKGTRHRMLVPQAVIEDLTNPAWQASPVSGELPPSVEEGRPADVRVELMDGDRAGWTGHGVLTVDESGVHLQGTDPFLPGV